MKTPEEIKKALECCARMTGCAACPYMGEKCALKVSVDTLEYIQQLEAQNAELVTKCHRLEERLDAPYIKATLKDVAERLKRLGFDCCYEGD